MVKKQDKLRLDNFELTEKSSKLVEELIVMAKEKRDLKKGQKNLEERLAHVAEAEEEVRKKILKLDLERKNCRQERRYLQDQGGFTKPK